MTNNLSLHQETEAEGTIKISKFKSLLNKKIGNRAQDSLLLPLYSTREAFQWVRLRAGGGKVASLPPLRRLSGARSFSEFRSCFVSSPDRALVNGEVFQLVSDKRNPAQIGILP